MEAFRAAKAAAAAGGAARTAAPSKEELRRLKSARDAAAAEAAAERRKRADAEAMPAPPPLSGLVNWSASMLFPAPMAMWKASCNRRGLTGHESHY